MKRSTMVTVCTTLILVATSCAEPGEGADAATDTGRVFPTADVSASSDTSPASDMAVGQADSTEQGSDSVPTPHADTHPGGEETSEGADTAVGDTTLNDTSVADLGPADTAPPVNGSCDPNGTWALNIVSAALPGQGCGEDGDPMQEDITQVLIVKPGVQGGFVATLKDHDDPIPTVQIQANGTTGLCQLKVVITVAVVVPGAGDVEGGTASVLYAYELQETSGAVTGAGAVTTSFVTESNKVLAECTEDISLAGTFVTD